MGRAKVIILVCKSQLMYQNKVNEDSQTIMKAFDFSHFNEPVPQLL